MTFHISGFPDKTRSSHIIRITTGLSLIFLALFSFSIGNTLRSHALGNTIWYVNVSAVGTNDGTSWTNAFTDLQSALGVAQSGDEIWVAKGTYKPTSSTNRNISFDLKSGVSVYGGFSATETVRTQRDWIVNTAILSGDIGTVGSNNDNSYHVVTAGETVNNATVLDGFTISSGNANFNIIGQDKGGGLFLTGQPFLSNLIVSNNYAEAYGGGAYSLNGAQLESLTFSNNIAGNGGGAVFYGSTTVSGTTFINNTAVSLPYGGFGSDGGASFVGLSNVTNTVFLSNTAPNSGGGASFRDEAHLVNVSFTGNTAQMNGGAGFGGKSTLVATSFNRNKASMVIGGASFSGPTVLSGTTFIDNIAEGNGNGGGAWFNNTATLTNTLFKGNSIANGGGGGAAFYYPATLYGTSFIGNQATFGGGVYFYESRTPSSIINSLFAGNTAVSENGNAIFLFDPSNLSGAGKVNIVFTTISSATPKSGSAVVVVAGSANITNTIIANHAVGIKQVGLGIANEDYNLFAQVTTNKAGDVNSGGHSFNGSADFLDPFANDYRLLGSSSALNRGIDVGVYTDLEGNTRPSDGGFDIGAFERTFVARSKVMLPIVEK